MRIATWNVNSLNVRLAQVLEWLGREAPDVLALQETKLEDHRFPVESFHELGYRALFSGQKTYNGVALISRQEGLHPAVEMTGFDDPQRRVLAASYAEIRVVNLYVPNGSEVGSEKYGYKLTWLTHLRQWLELELKKFPRLIVLGDFNIAPEDRDVHDPERWRDQILCSPAERSAFQSLINLGLRDAYRCFEQPENSFTWWDYRLNGFSRNLGLRIDHILVSELLAPSLRHCLIDRGMRGAERPSDHAPVLLHLAV